MANKTRFEGAVALITGGASGIGQALGEECAARGSEVVLADRQQERAESVAEAIRGRGGKARAVALDVRDADAFESVAAEVVARSGRIDLFFNNAGVGVAGEADQYARDDWDYLLDVNVRGVVYGIQAVYPHMVTQGSGHIVNTASMAGLIPTPGVSSYSLSKHGVVGLTKALRIEASFHGVRASAVCPGAIRTPILTGGEYGRTDHTGLDESAMLELWEKLRPMDPNVFARLVLDDVARNKPFIIVPRWWKVLWLFDRLAPRLSLRVWRRMHAGVRDGMRPDTGSGQAAERDTGTTSSATTR